MKVIKFGFIFNSAVLVWLSWISWQAFSEGNLFNMTIFLGLVTLNLGVLCMQWATIKINRCNNLMLEEQRKALDIMLSFIAEVESAQKENEQLHAPAQEAE